VRCKNRLVDGRRAAQHRLGFRPIGVVLLKAEKLAP
jgi:hypothetical protein